MQIVSFKEAAIFDESRVKTKVIIETLFSKEIRILLAKDQVMKEHKTPFPILIHILEGRIELGVQGLHQTMHSGDIIALDGNVPHDLRALEDAIIRLTLSKHDKVERVEAVVREG